MLAILLFTVSRNAPTRPITPATWGPWLPPAETSCRDLGGWRGGFRIRCGPGPAASGHLKSDPAAQQVH
jgi:hypothetical protein